MKMKLTLGISVVAALLAAAAPALAGQLQPARPVAPNLYSGRWYEIARTPNKIQADCEGATTEFSSLSPGGFQVVQTCHKGAPTGPLHTVSAHGQILPASQNAKMQLGLLGGLIPQQYWILDHSDDNAWLIMAVPSDRYVWLMSRRPVLDAKARAAALARLQQLGFNLQRLAFPKQPAG
jgi:apolipoprotein D and lipocalin family protein